MNLLVHELDEAGTDRSAQLAAVKKGDVLLVTDPGGEVVSVTVSDTPTYTAPYFSFPFVTFVTGTEPTDEEPVDLSLVISGPPGPPGSSDAIAPPTPTIWSVTPSTTVLNVDGTSMTNFLADVGYIDPVTPGSPPSGLDDLAEIMLESTRFPRDDDNTLPDWTRATVWISASGDGTGAINTQVVQPNVLASEGYWMRAFALDRSGNRSTESNITYTLSSEDEEAPPPPTNIVVEAGMSTIGVRWDQVLAPDFAFAEVAYRKLPDGNWTTVQVAGTMVVIAGLENSNPSLVPPVVVEYAVRLRSVDLSGNTLVDPLGSASTKASASPEAGWVTTDVDGLPLIASPSPIPGNSLVWTEAMIGELFGGKINADWITAGTLKVGGGAGHADAIEVYQANPVEGEPPILIGTWGEDGISITDPLNPNYRMAIAESSIHIYDITDPANPFAVVSITPLGIDAASVTYGSARGGHNLVQNSSFETGAFSATDTRNQTWTTSTDWNAAGSRQGSDVNITTNAGDLQMTTVV